MNNFLTKLLSRFPRKLLFITLSILTIVGYGAFVFASAPPGGYTPGTTLDPDCAPNDVDCIVALPSGSSVTADNGLTATGGNVQLGGSLLSDTTIDTNDHTFSFDNNGYHFQSSPDNWAGYGTLFGTSVPGIGFYNDTLVDGGYSQIGIMDIDGEPMIVTGQLDLENNILNGLLVADGEVQLVRTTDNSVQGVHMSPNGLELAYVNSSDRNKFKISNSGITFSFEGGAQSYTFPKVDGTAGQVLATDGAGLLSWTTPSGGGGSSPVVIGGAMNDTLYTPSLGAGAGGYYPGPDVGGNIIFGLNAGNGANNAVLSTFLGYHAGENATNASFLNAIGLQAGQNATNAAQSNFFGQNAGRGASQVIRSTFLGDNTGVNATNASDSFFVGQYAGGFAANASNSIFIGDQAGNNDTVNNTANSNDFSILLGSHTSTGGYSNSIALGQRAINTASNQFMIGSSTRPISETVWILDNMGATATLNTSGVITTSDERLKNITGDLSNDTLDKLINLKTVNFTWKSDNSLNPTPNIGFVAQNVHEYFPELTYESSTGYLGVNYAGMTPILVEAIREMNLKFTTISDMNTPNTWRDSLIAWFGNAMNGITDLYVKVFHADRAEVGELCVKKSDGTNVCVNGDQLQTLLQPGIVPQTPSIPSTPPDNQTPPADPTTNDDQPGDSLDNTTDDQSTSDTDSDTNSSDTTGDSSGTVSQ